MRLLVSTFEIMVSCASAYVDFCDETLEDASLQSFSLHPLECLRSEFVFPDTILSVLFNFNFYVYFIGRTATTVDCSR